MADRATRMAAKASHTLADLQAVTDTLSKHERREWLIIVPQVKLRS
jgi:hypothetical protein